MPNWHWLLDPLVLAYGGLSITVLMNIWCFFHHRRWQQKHPSKPMPVWALVKNHLFASTVLTICAMGILYAFFGLWSWVGSFLIALAIWVCPLIALMIVFLLLVKTTLTETEREEAKGVLTVQAIVMSLFVGSPFMLTYCLLLILWARIRAMDWGPLMLSISWAFEDACDYVGDFLEECWRVITNAVAFLTNARYWLFSSLFSWFTGIKTPPNYRQYN